jgi:uncharacterized protein
MTWTPRVSNTRCSLNENERAGNCIDCDVCEGQCPQKIAISEWMPKVAALLA